VEMETPRVDHEHINLPHSFCCFVLSQRVAVSAGGVSACHQAVVVVVVVVVLVVVVIVAVVVVVVVVVIAAAATVRKPGRNRERGVPSHSHPALQQTLAPVREDDIIIIVVVVVVVVVVIVVVAIVTTQLPVATAAAAFSHCSRPSCTSPPTTIPLSRVERV
jgi:hypothetical protein